MTRICCTLAAASGDPIRLAATGGLAAAGAAIGTDAAGAAGTGLIGGRMDDALLTAGMLLSWITHSGRNTEQKMENRKQGTELISLFK
jgi:hypothetical protein